MNKLDLVKRIFKTQVKRYIPELSLTFLFIILTSLTTAATAWLLDPAIKEIFENKNTKMLYIIPIAIILTFIIKAFAVYGTRIVTIKVGIKIIKNIQTLMAKKFLLSDISHITKKHSGKYLSHFTNDTGILFGVLTGVVVTLFKESFTLIALLGLMFYHDWQLSLLAIIMIPIAAISSKNLGKKMGKKVNISLEASDKFLKFLSEIIKGSWLIKIYQKEEEELKRISMIIDERFKAIRKVEQTRLGAGPIMEVISAIAIAVVVFFAGYRSMQGAITLGEFVSFLAALMLAYQPVRALAGINIGIQEGISAAKRIYELIDQKNEIYHDENAPSLKLINASIEFKNISFTYPDGTQALKNLSAKIEGGTKVGLVGVSGSGKTTFLNLIPRFFHLKNGSIFIDNQNINDINLNSLRKEISLVSQDVILFDDTIKANILYGNALASNEEIIKACKFAAAQDFVEKLPNKYETIIGENGIKLSGGQKQRLSIARAILKNSSIILLDEATSSLDSESESVIQKAIENLTKNKTTIIIAHRLSTVMNCDKILVFENGKIIEEGKHEFLVNNSLTYKKLYEKQIIN
ncbi:ABC transporter ATP-binding protein [Candidatus Fonsibacter ubiquis]|uniref:ABC transporter ATP-binding protein n=1 Tax=Candidatus Fonsibacter ubiquis TaxID=1925548 RepID=UPI000C07D6A8|nr:ABC transporter ATP-binding protein [Candidatus Fonsibacter ubiquis]